MILAEPQHQLHHRVVRVLQTKAGRRRGQRDYFVLLDNGDQHWVTERELLRMKRDFT